jgi:uncharacterized membrane protein YheB (UPF0754 family)
MKLEDLVQQSKNSDFYRRSIKKLSQKKLQKLEKIAFELHENGASDPISWALSEVEENIAQSARFYFLKELLAVAENIHENVKSIDFDESLEETYSDICKSVGQEKMDAFLKSYGKDILGAVVNVIDYSSSSPTVGWQLVETDGEGELTGRGIDGLHEDWLDFNE